MGEKPNPQRDIAKWTTNGLLGIALAGGTPYIAALQAELRQTHDAVIRLEERDKAKDEAWRQMQIEQQRLREQIEKLTNALHDRKIVGSISTANTVAGERHNEE